MLESKPSRPVVFPPPDYRTPYRVKTGDSWASIAKAYFLDPWWLIEFNFPAVIYAADFQTMCRQVNWLLRKHLGCAMTNDGMNYRFDSSDSPGVIYIPYHGRLSSSQAESKFMEYRFTDVFISGVSPSSGSSQ